ncbi:elongation factor Ts [bacterium]|jgi:elongation factor Ts|nr:elongation factor Ts [bacterium]
MSITAASVKELREKTGVGMMACKKALVEANGDMDSAIKYLREKGLAAASKKSARTTAEGQIFIELSADRKKGVILELNCETDFVATNDSFKLFGAQIAQTVLESNAATTDDVDVLTVNGKSFQESISETILKVGENINLTKIARIDSEGEVFSYLHSNGKLGVLVETTVSLDDKEIGKDIAMQVAAANPSCVRPEEVASDELEKEKDIIRAQALNEGKPAQVVEKIVMGRISKYYKENCLIEQEFVKDSDKKIKQILPKGADVTQFVRFSLT